MAGLVEEGAEVIAEGKQMEEAAADLALIGAAQRVEHYEIAAYGTARAIAEQMNRQDIVKLLSQTLAEEEKADQLLTKLAQPLLEEAGQAQKRNWKKKRSRDEHEDYGLPARLVNPRRETGGYGDSLPAIVLICDDSAARGLVSRDTIGQLADRKNRRQRWRRGAIAPANGT